MTATLTQQESEALIFGCNIESAFPWWIGLSGPIFEERFERDAYGEAPDGWSYQVNLVDPSTGDSAVRMVTHSVLLGAMRRIVAGVDMTGLIHRQNPDPDVVACVRAYLNEPDPDRLSSEAIDQILQVAVYDGIVHI
ncbi:hypothetical protein ABT282_07205 [Streptomyces sp. NPDC000927]|uniref:hypothetical protein n=1 Tax=Streptomyces sp. NPDC000927 TaxID=3154371 RepID=UPI0033223C10